MNPFPGLNPTLFVAVAAWMIAAAPDAQAVAGAPPAFTVGRVECAWLERTEFTRLLELELAVTAAGEDLPPLTLDLTCGAAGVTIVVRDPERTQQIERTVPTPESAEAGRERQIAITVAQFAGALWRLREAEEQAARSEEPQPSPAEPPAPPDATASPTTPAESPSRLRWTLELTGGVRGRALETDGRLASGFGELSAVAWLLDRVGVVAALALEGTNVDRAGGSVGGLAFGVGLGLVGRLVERSPFALDARLLLGGGYVRFSGRTEDPASYAAGSTDGGAGEVRLEIAPSLELGRFLLALSLQGGYALPVTIAVVRGDDDVSFSGWWAGAGLRVGFGFGDPD